jgi:glycosyltransferase involved in cell wall biosynthesis
MKILIVAASDSTGGGSRAALRLHRAFLDHGCDCRMRVDAKRTDFETISASPTRTGRFLSRIRPLSGQIFMRMQNTPNVNPHSPAVFRTGLQREINRSDADVVLLTWIGREIISVGEIAGIDKPLVWRMSDMWTFCGNEHYAPDDEEARWRTGYKKNTRPKGSGRVDLDAWTFRRKLRSWKKPMHLIAPSRWLHDCVKDSALAKNWPVTHIPSLIDTSIYRPWPKAIARELFGLPKDRKLVLFGAHRGKEDPRKGWRFLEAALMQIAETENNIQVAVFGQSAPVRPVEIALPFTWIGRLQDDHSLALLYSAADVMVIPSLQDNLPLTGIEAQSAGCPVAVFDATGSPDVVEHRVTGYVAKAFDSSDLARGIKWIVEDHERHLRLSSSARKRALALWAPDIVIPKYLEVFSQVINAG